MSKDKLYFMMLILGKEFMIEEQNDIFQKRQRKIMRLSERQKRELRALADSASEALVTTAKHYEKKREIKPAAVRNSRKRV